MIFKHLLPLLTIVVSAMTTLEAKPSPRQVSLCSIKANPDDLMNEMVEVRALVFRGFESSSLEEGKCRIRYAFGDNYRAFGNRFPVKHNDQWGLMQTLLNARNNCSVNAGRIRAKIQGTVIRTPASGTTPEDEMPVELVIQSVDEVEAVPIDCIPPNAR